MNKIQVEILNNLDYTFFENINFIKNFLEYVDFVKEENDKLRSNNSGEMV